MLRVKIITPNGVTNQVHNFGTATPIYQSGGAILNPFNADNWKVQICVAEYDVCIEESFTINSIVEDTTPPIIAEVNIPSGNPVRFNQSDFNLEVYVNEPSECKWSRTDQSYDNMEQQMNCAMRIFQMNNKNLYTCKTTLTGIQDRVDNDYYFRCKDQPQKPEGDRNVNTQSYPYFKNLELNFLNHVLYLEKMLQ